MQLSYEPSLVALSLLIAVQGSYVALLIALRIRSAQARSRRLLLAGAAISLAVGIWGMHFLGMLAARLPLPVNYLVLPTLVSFLICVLVVGFALAAISFWPRSALTLATAPVAMGSGIVTMHYTGMWALHASTRMVHDPPIVALSVLISIVTSALALWLTFDEARRPSLFVSASLLGLAISGMHFTAMAGTSFYPLSMSEPESALSVSPDLLAIIVTVVAFAVSGGFLLTFVPEHSEPTALENLSEDSPATSEVRPVISITAQAEAEIVLSKPLPSRPSLAAQSLPIERDGFKTALSFEHVFAVRADAHYTFIFDGKEDLFCPLGIGEVEELLARAHFLRVHRSHIVNLQRIKLVRKSGDSAVAELTSPLPKTVPVSRTKIHELRALVSERSSAETA